LLSVGALVAGALALALTGALPGPGGTPRAAARAGAGEPFVYTDDSVPAREVTMIGATPDEAGGGTYETWGVGNVASAPALVRYAAGSGWSLGPGLQDEAGEPLTGFKLDEPGAALSSTAGPSTLAGQMTADGAGVLAGEVAKKQVLLVREPNNPANPFRETKPVPEVVMEPGDRLFGFQRAPLIVPLDEAGGQAGALVVPVEELHSGFEEDVLHWNNATGEWTREKIELPSGASFAEFRVLGIGASSPGNAWLLGELSSAGSVALFHRQLKAGEASWQPVALKSGGEPGEPLAIGDEQVTIPEADRERVQTQVLTVTSQGVWIDGERPEREASATLFFQPEGGPAMTSWCTAGRPLSGSTECEHSLPEALPTGPSRSIAWAGASKFGERVITGLAEGVSLRLEGEQFKFVLALGGGASSSVGATYGAAFSNPREGWLGNSQLPVHLTGEEEQSRLTPWQTSFRHALIAIAPHPAEPEKPVGSLSSEENESKKLVMSLPMSPAVALEDAFESGVNSAWMPSSAVSRAPEADASCCC